MKPDLNTECMHSNKRRAIQHKDAKCPFTAPIEAQHNLLGRCRAQVGQAMLWPRAVEHASPCPHCALEHFEMSKFVTGIWGTRKGGRIQELPAWPSSLLVPLLAVWKSEVTWGPWPLVLRCTFWSICPNKANPLREQQKSLVQTDASVDAFLVSPTLPQLLRTGGRISAALKGCMQAPPMSPVGAGSEKMPPPCRAVSASSPCICTLTVLSLCS